MPGEPELSQAGEDFGRAFCLAPDRQAVPLPDLTPTEQACVTRTGLGWQERVAERLGGLAPPTDGIAFPVMAPTGRPVAHLSMAADGTVTLCLPQGGCAVVGQGPAAAQAAEETLTLLGLRVGDTAIP